MPTDSCWFVFLPVLVLVWLAATGRRRPHSASCRAAVIAPVQRLLKPRTPDDCPACRQQAPPAGSAPLRPPLPPWREQKSRRGAPKRINTQGFACPNRICVYYRFTDAQVHALVGDGAHGQCERIQTLRWRPA
jgi:hypothetical protein